jgi:hypothetical protein
MKHEKNKTLFGKPKWLTEKNDREFVLRIKSVIACLIMITLFNWSCQKMEEEQLGTNSEKFKAPSQLMSTSPDAGDEFTIAVLGDTQNYEDYDNDHEPKEVDGDSDDQDCQERSSFQTIIGWLVSNKTTENIKYVASVGDITDNYGARDTESDAQWSRARTDYQPLFDANIPFGVVPGNHDIDFADPPYTSGGKIDFPTHPFFYDKFSRIQWANEGTTYNKVGYPNPSSNQNHIDVVNMGPTIGNVAVIYLRWQHWEPDADDAINWAWTTSQTSTYKAMKKIVVTHYAVADADDDGDGKKDWGQQRYWPTHPFSQAEKLYNKFKADTNFFMMLGGHEGGDQWRHDTYNGHTVLSYSSDYSGVCGTTEGIIRTMKFSKANDRIEFKNLVSPNTILKDFYRPWNHNFTTTRTNDYDNNGKSNAAFFNNGAWTIIGGTNDTWGTTGDIPVPGDYNTDGETEIATYTPSTGVFKVKGGSTITLGASGDIPVPGDFDGNGSTNYAVYKPSTRIFTIYKSGGNISSAAIGSPGDIPVPLDYDGDGKVDYATFNPTTAVWTIVGVSTGQYGVGNDIPVPGDYYGTGKNNRAVYRPSNHSWYISGTTGPVSTLGAAGDIPAPGDYNGDGKTDYAVYRPSTGQILIDGQTTISTGVINGKPLNLPYHIRKFFFP